MHGLISHLTSLSRHCLMVTHPKDVSYTVYLLAPRVLCRFHKCKQRVTTGQFGMLDWWPKRRVERCLPVTTVTH
jgi:hypothetical protein